MNRLEPDIFRQLLAYNPDTGVLTWKPRPASMFEDGRHSADHNAEKWNARFCGKPALTSKNGRGYMRGAIFSKPFFAHRVAWALHYGNLPDGQIDHINGNRSDNRIENLRCVTPAENNRNRKAPSTNTSGVIGVFWRADIGKWQSRIWGDGKEKSLGYFTDFDAAVSARRAAEVALGYHQNHGRPA